MNLQRKIIFGLLPRFKERAILENPLTSNQNIFEYIDAQQDIESLKQFDAFLNIDQLIKVFWDSFKKYFSTKSALEKRKAQIKCAYITRYFGSGVPLNRNIN